MRRLTLLVLAVLPGCSSRAQEANRAAVDPVRDQHVAPPRDTADQAVRTRMFADDVPKDLLALSIAIETYGGISTILIPRGTPLPTVHREAFSTATDDQASVEIHMLQGERPRLADNRSLGRFQLVGIPQAPRGVPQIDVTFAIDADGVLTVTAKDRATGASRVMRIQADLPGALDRKAVEAVLADAAANAAEDAVHRDRLAAVIELQNLVLEGRRLLEIVHRDITRVKLPAGLQRRVEIELDRADKAVVLHGTDGDPATIRAATAPLRATIHAATKALYDSAPP